MPEFQLSPPDQPHPDEDKDQNATAFSVPDETPTTVLTEDVPLDTREEITSAELPDRVCTQCLEDNLVRSGVIETFVKCQKCGEEFCIHGVSKLDPQFCIHCCNDFKVVDVVEQEQRPIYNKNGQLIAVRQFKVRHITLSGLHWLFFNRAITSLTDTELEHAIEYHMSIYHGMIYEREARRVQKSQRNKGKHASNEATLTSSSFEPSANGMQFVLSNKPTTVKKVRTRTIKVTQSSAAVSGKGKAAPSQEAVNALVQTLLNAGFTQEQIMAMGAKK